MLQNSRGFVKRLLSFLGEDVENTRLAEAGTVILMGSLVIAF